MNVVVYVVGSAARRADSQLHFTLGTRHCENVGVSEYSAHIRARASDDDSLDTVPARELDDVARVIDLASSRGTSLQNGGIGRIA